MMSLAANSKAWGGVQDGRLGKEYWVRLPMPWKRTAFAINWDEMRRGRPCLFAACSVQFRAFHLRIGWAFIWDE